MNSNLFRTILNWVLVTSLALSAFFCFQFIRRARQIPRVEVQLVNAQNNQRKIAAIVNDVMEYSRRDAGVDPILEVIGIKVNRPATASSKPTGN
jgi:hypothetical protein